MKSHTHKHKKAFTLIELLLSLAILGMLMAAVAFAFDASVTNYQANEGIYRTLNTGRQILLRITNDIRTAESVASESDDSVGELTLRTAAGQDVTYRFDSADKVLYLHTADGDYVLCRNVTAMSFNRHPQLTPPIRNVRIVMTLTDPQSGVSQKLAAAAVVRRNISDD